jgi:hypothetical protein
MLQITNYSDKAVKVSGDTKQYKDRLKELGGRFNPFLTGGPGWIFSRGKLPELETFISEVQAVTVNTGSYLNTAPAPVKVEQVEQAEQVPPPAPDSFTLENEKPKSSTPPAPPANKPKKEKKESAGAFIARVLKYFKPVKSIPATDSVKVDSDGCINLCLDDKVRSATDFIHISAADMLTNTTGQSICIDLLSAKGAKDIQLMNGAAIIDGMKVAALDYADDFPEAPTGKKAPECLGSLSVPRISKDHLGKDELRPIMMGININGPAGELCSTDAHTLYVQKVDTDIKESITLPPAPLMFFEGQKVDVYRIDRTAVQISATNNPGVKITLKEIDGRYPNYRCVIPEQSDKHLTMSAGLISYFNAELPKLLKAANKGTKRMQMQLSAAGIVLSSEDLDFGTEYKTTYEFHTGSYKGEPIEIYFDITRFQRCMKDVQPGDVLNLSEPHRAGLFTGAGREILIMPLMKEKQ